VNNAKPPENAGIRFLAEWFRRQISHLPINASDAIFPFETSAYGGQVGIAHNLVHKLCEESFDVNQATAPSSLPHFCALNDSALFSMT
jgi:hypothetical protein